MRKFVGNTNKILKNDICNSGITLIALVLTIIVLLILAGVSIATLTGPNGLITRANEAKEATKQAEKDELAMLQAVEDSINAISPSKQGFNEGKFVNAPKLAKGMIPIKHNGTNWVVCSETDATWYNYDSKKEWANVMLSDGKYKAGQVAEGTVINENELGSMFVWIPRYAYQINGEKDIGITFLAGNTNEDKDGKVYEKANASSNTKTTKVVHPAFTLGQRELNGIWVAKFEASGVNKDGVAVGNASADSSSAVAPDETTTVKILPNVVSWRHITVGESQRRSMDMASTNKDVYGLDYANSHLMKNSEWGAVAYLAYSDCGTRPYINATGESSSSGWYNLYTGQGPKNANSDDGGTYAHSEDHNYNTPIGKSASTTGNVTGVYDMSGGAWERVAAYLDNNNGNLNQGAPYFEGNKLKAEYASLWDAYEVSEEEKTNKIMVDGVAKSQSDIWSWNNKTESYHEARRRITEATFKNMARHKGIGVNEMATEFSFYAPFSENKESRGWFKTVAEAVAGTQKYATSWDNDYVLIGHASYPFVGRGGACASGGHTGVLSMYITNGGANYISGFRPVVVL